MNKDNDCVTLHCMTFHCTVRPRKCINKVCDCVTFCIVLSGRESVYAKYVKEYVLSYSDDGKSWTMYPKVRRDLHVVIEASPSLSGVRNKRTTNSRKIEQCGRKSMNYWLFLPSPSYIWIADK